MNTTKRSAARAGLVVCCLFVGALTGCRTHVVHERTRTVYVPAPPPVVHVTPAPAPQPPPPVVVVASPAQPPVVVIQSESDFYAPLTPYGRWVEVGAYGRCWIPAHVDPGWRPYANGYWQRTDAGWYWVSEEPWGWATYHYGRWDFHARHGWIWVPHTQWAPAWVTWREGGGYVGWAPLRPSVTFGVNIGVADYEPAFASRAYVFVEHRRMLDPIRPRTVIVNNTTIINKTVNITNVKVVNKTVINEGPRPEVIERASGRKLTALAAHEFRRKEEATVAAQQRPPRPVGERNVEASTPPAVQAVEQKITRTPTTRDADQRNPVVTQPPRPPVTPARPTPQRPVIEGAARVETKPANANTQKVAPTPQASAPKANPASSPQQTAPPRGDIRPVESPAASARPTSRPITKVPVSQGIRETDTTMKTDAVAPPAIARQPGTEIRTGARPETKQREMVEAAPATAVGRQLAPPTQRPAAKRPVSPRAQSQSAEQAESNGKAKSEDQVTPRAASGRPNR